MTDPTKIDEWKVFRGDPEKWLVSNNQLTLSELERRLGVNRFYISSIANELNLCNYIKHQVSSMEHEVSKFFLELDPDIEIIRHYRKLDDRSEIDIYLPEYNLGVECNPTYTHNSSLGDCWGGEPKSIHYHQRKSDLCESQGIQLFHIFGYEWKHKKEIIKSMLANKLGKNVDRVFARKCSVVELSTHECKQFLDDNHRQGDCSASIRLGLKYQNKLVSVMTFGKGRHTLSKNDLSQNGYELIRFCNKLNTSVVGGASKLFKYFINTYSPDEIISYSDRAHTSGNLYSMLEFREVRRSDPGYVWVDIKTDRAYNRINSQKQNISRFLNDDSIDLSKTESQIMIEHGYVRVYDSGTITWLWRSY